MRNEQVNEAINTAIEEYNEVRPHQSINFLTLSKAHKMTGYIPNRWRKYPHKPKKDCLFLFNSMRLWHIELNKTNNNKILTFFKFLKKFAIGNC